MKLKLREKEEEKILEEQKTPDKNFTVEALGFCLKNELSPEDQKEWDRISDILRKEIWEKKPDESENNEMGVVVSNPLSEEDRKIWHELNEKKYSNFHFAAPGYKEETMEWAKSHNNPLPYPIPKGAKFYYTYPLSRTAVFETTEEITMSADFIEAFVDGYIEIYRLEEETSPVKSGRMCDIDSNCSLINRNRTGGVFGIWGHHIGDLVLEGVNVFDEGKAVTFIIGS